MIRYITMRKLMTASDPFGELMARHIYKVVLLCSEYDQFLIEEDGRVEEELFREYTQLGLSNPPKITYARNMDEVFMLLATNKFDLVVTMLELGSSTVVDCAQAIKTQYPHIPIVALSPSPA